MGYVVASVSYHGSSGFGYAFLDSITHRWGELELQDMEAATDWLLKKPWADKRAFAATGGSYGGYLVAWMNGHVPHGRYAAYVCHAGCFDWTAMFADDAFPGTPRSWARGTGTTRPGGAQSASTFAAAMRTPTLVVHGALDYRVPDARGLAYYNTLKAARRRGAAAVVPGREPLDLKPRNSPPVVRRVLRLAGTARPGRARGALPLNPEVAAGPPRPGAPVGRRLDVGPRAQHRPWSVRPSATARYRAPAGGARNRAVSSRRRLAHRIVTAVGSRSTPSPRRRHAAEPRLA